VEAKNVSPDPMPMQAALDRRARRIKTGWAGFMLLGGAALIVADLSDHQHGLALLQGGWQFVCTIAIYLLPLQWWTSSDPIAEDVYSLWELLSFLLEIIASLCP